MSVFANGMMRFDDAGFRKYRDGIAAQLDRLPGGVAVQSPSSADLFLAVAAASRMASVPMVVGQHDHRASGLTIAKLRESAAGDFESELIVHRGSSADPDFTVAFWTSGSTGPRKLVLHEAAAMDYQASVTANRMAMDKGRWGVALPLDHAYGYSLSNAWMEYGQEFHWFSLNAAKSIVRAISSGSLDSFDTISSVWHYLLPIARRDAEFCSGLRGLRVRGVGGQVLSRKLDLAFRDIGAPLHDGYGLTEAGPNVSINVGTDYLPGTVGLPLVDTGVKIVNDELYVASRSVSRKVWQNGEPQNNPAVDSKGWLRTGDAASLQEGRIVIHGRLDSIVQQYAEKIPLETLEGHLRDAMPTGSIIDLAIVGHDVSGDIVGAFVNGSDSSKADLIREARKASKALPRPFSIASVVWVGDKEYAAGPLRKVDRRMLSQLVPSKEGC